MMVEQMQLAGHVDAALNESSNMDSTALKNREND
jgi:hypothetical protein